MTTITDKYFQMGSFCPYFAGEKIHLKNYSKRIFSNNLYQNHRGKTLLFICAYLLNRLSQNVPVGQLLSVSFAHPPASFSIKHRAWPTKTNFEKHHTIHNDLILKIYKKICGSAAQKGIKTKKITKIENKVDKNKQVNK